MGGVTRGLRELGYSEGKNLVIEWRWAEGHYDRLPDLAADLVRSHVDVMVVEGSPSAVAAQKATTTIPIVFGAVFDPVAIGVVSSLARPGGNITGITVNVGGAHDSVKQLEMLRTTIPGLSRVGVLTNPGNPGHSSVLEELRKSAATLGIAVIAAQAGTASEIESAYQKIKSRDVQAGLLLGDSFYYQQRGQIGQLALRHRLPVAGPSPQYVEAGLLMSYGMNRTESFRQAAAYVDKILKGANPAELPVQQPTQLDVVLNRRVARALGIEFPPEVMLMATRVIE
jgi:putative ABC transport system substrate-binding protein